MYQTLPLRLLPVTALATIVAIASSDVVGAAEQAKPATPPVRSEPTTTTASYGNWVLRCVRPAAENNVDKAGDKNCEVQQTIQVQGRQQPLAQLAIGHLPGDRALVLTAVLPVDVAIPGMVHLSGNGKTGADEKSGVDLVWTRCIPAGCFANGKPADKDIALLNAETNGQIRFADASGRVVAIPVSWSGLSQALKALNEQP